MFSAEKEKLIALYPQLFKVTLTTLRKIKDHLLSRVSRRPPRATLTRRSSTIRTEPSQREAVRRSRSGESHRLVMQMRGNRPCNPLAKRSSPITHTFTLSYYHSIFLIQFSSSSSQLGKLFIISMSRKCFLVFWKLYFCSTSYSKCETFLDGRRQATKTKIRAFVQYDGPEGGFKVRETSSSKFLILKWDGK